MTKNELIKSIVNKVENVSQKDVASVLVAFQEVVKEELVKGGKIQLIGFGTFEVAERAAREGRNPATGEIMHIESSKAPKFKFAKNVKDLVKNA